MSATSVTLSPMAGEAPLPPQPRVTVFVPAYNEAEAITPCLDSLLAQSYPGELTEVLVVDGRSSDGTVGVVTEYVREHQAALAARGLTVRVVDNPEQSLAAAWNLAAAAATGDIIAFVSAHSHVLADYLGLAVRHLQEGSAHVVGGPCRMVGATTVGRAIAAAMSSPFGVGPSLHRFAGDVPDIASVANAVYPLAVLRQHLPFDEDIGKGEDWEMHYRMRQAGVRLAQHADMAYEYHARPTLRGLWRQQWSYAQAKVNIMRKHSRRAARLTHFVPLGLVLFTLGGGIGAAAVPALRPVWGVGAGLYLFGNVLSSIWAARRHGWATLPLLPWAFICMHFAYGLGMLWQLVGGPRRPQPQSVS